MEELFITDNLKLMFFMTDKADPNIGMEGLEDYLTIMISLDGAAFVDITTLAVPTVTSRSYGWYLLEAPTDPDTPWMVPGEICFHITNVGSTAIPLDLKVIGKINAETDTKVLELWQRMAMDMNNPETIDKLDSEIRFASVVLDVDESDPDHTVITRTS